MKKWLSLLVTFGVESLKLRHFLQINLEIIQFNSKRTLNPDQDTTKTRRFETKTMLKKAKSQPRLVYLFIWFIQGPIPILYILLNSCQERAVI